MSFRKDDEILGIGSSKLNRASKEDGSTMGARNAFEEWIGRFERDEGADEDGHAS